MATRQVLYGLSPPVAPRDSFGGVESGKVKGGAVWTKYYDAYARYTACVTGQQDVFVSIGSSHVGDVVVGGVVTQNQLRCCRDVGQIDAKDGRESQVGERECEEVDGGFARVGGVSQRRRLLGAIHSNGLGNVGKEGDLFESGTKGTERVDSTVLQYVNLDSELFGCESLGTEALKADVVEQAVSGGEAVGSNTLRNRLWRQERKERKQRKQLVQSGVPLWRQKDGNGNGKGLSSKVGFFSELGDEERKSLRESRAKRLEAENKLQQAKAERALELLRASDVEKEKKMNETRVMRNTELNKVQVEQAFSRLSATGNVPGFAETVVSGTPTLSSGSISPNSSVSAAEVHAMQKELLELQLQSKEFSRLKESVKKYIPESVYDNLVRESAKTADTSFTADTMGHELANGGGYHYCDDGRYRPGERFDGW